MDLKIAEFVTWIESGDADTDLVNDAKAWTWEYEAEHALLELSTGELAIVRGGRDGISFVVKGEGDGRTLHMDVDGREVRIALIHWHTHPRVTGPSDGDLEALAILKQTESLLYEIGAPHGTRIRQKTEPPAD